MNFSSCAPRVRSTYVPIAIPNDPEVPAAALHAKTVSTHNFLKANTRVNERLGGTS